VSWFEELLKEVVTLKFGDLQLVLDLASYYTKIDNFDARGYIVRAVELYLQNLSEEDSDRAEKRLQDKLGNDLIRIADDQGQLPKMRGQALRFMCVIGLKKWVLLALKIIRDPNDAGFDQLKPVLNMAAKQSIIDNRITLD